MKKMARCPALFAGLLLAASWLFAGSPDAVLEAGAKVEKVADGFQFTEGPVWDRNGGFLLFSDIPANAIMKWSPKDGVSVYQKQIFKGDYPPGTQVGTNGLAIDNDGRIVAAEHGDRRVARFEKGGATTTLADKYDGRQLNSPNDVVIRKNGDIYFTDPPFGLLRPGQGVQDIAKNPDRDLDFNGVYRITVAGKLEVLSKALALPNGLAFSPDEKKLYVADSAGKTWSVFDVKSDGTLARDQIFFNATGENGRGVPDGMKVDTAGNIWATGPGGILVISPGGKLLGTIAFPEDPANCAWGDADGKTLYVTARTGLYRIRSKIAGVRP
jgi:gluconolactonase